MPITVNGPGGVSINFPDGTDAATIDGAMRQHFGGGEKAASPVGVNDVVRATGRGIPIIGGLLNKADAALNAGLAPVVEPFLAKSPENLTEGTSGFGERYQKALGIQNKMDTDFERAHSVINTGAELAGGVAATLPLAATATGARLLGLTGRTLPGQIARGAASGAGINTADAVIRGDDPISSAGVGAGVGAGAPIAGRAISAAISPVMNTIRGIVSPGVEAGRRVAGAMQRDIAAGTAGLEPAEYAAARNAGTPVNLMDQGGETTRALARSAANTSPEGRAVLNQSIDDRFQTQGDRLTDWLRSTFHYPDANAQQAALDQLGKTVNKSAYDLAHVASENRHPGGIWSPELERLTSSPDVVDAMQGAAKRGAGRAVAEGYGGFNPGVTFDNGIMNFKKGPNGIPAYPDLRFWDYSYRNLRDKADEAFRAGRNSEGNSLKTQANQLRTELDQMVPEFGEARSGAAKFFGANDALEAGQNFVNSKLGNQEARLALAKMSSQEKQLFQDGYVDRLVKQLRESPDRRSVLNKFANSSADRERLNIALGPQRARELEAMMRVEGIMDLARPAVQGNSTTARQLTELGLAGGADVLSGGGMPSMDPQALMNAALVYGAARGHRAIDHRISQQVARLLTSSDPASIANGMRMVSQNRMLGALRLTDANLASVAARGSVPAMTNH